MDIIKDYLLVQLLAQYIFDFGKDRTTDEDYYLFAVSIFSLMIGHISILCVTVPNRYESVLNILCRRILLNILIVILFRNFLSFIMCKGMTHFLFARMG